MMQRIRRLRQHLMTHSRGANQQSSAEGGSAIIEFLGVALLLLVPLIYLILVLAKIQAATFAVQGAAKDVGRAYVLSESTSQGAARAAAAVQLALQDQGFVAADGTLEMFCGQSDCLAPGGTITAAVTIPVDLPGVPNFVQNFVPVSIPVSASHVTVVDQLRAQS